MDRYQGSTTAGKKSPRSSRSPTTSPRSENFKKDKLNQQIIDLKAKREQLQEDGRVLKATLEEGGSRHGKIKTVEKMVIESRKQIQSMMEKNQQLNDSIDDTLEERDHGFRSRDERIAELLQLIAEREATQSTRKENDAKRMQVHKVVDANNLLRAQITEYQEELERERAEKDRLRELLNVYIAIRQDLRSLLTNKKQVDDLVRIEIDAFSFKTL
eukprot:TRINITY_DN1145_c0_g1_i3.p1 TRINITY_DN1145_c0_g1~~TRINITY_DN1145_c0_g1_i3.p1  ORF type:complete len:215 (-),score=84.30 TRINITY_DN1145_c0_g1_i3:364-1008(-)